MCCARVLLVVHLFRQSQLKKLSSYIKAIQNADVSLTVYFSVVSLDDDLKKRLLNLVPHAQIVVVSNKGYDIGPFFQILQRVDLDDYDYIVKFHTKDIRLGIICTFGKNMLSRRQWRNYLLNAVAENSVVFKNNLEHFKDDPTLGMIASSYLTVKFPRDLSETSASIVECLNISQKTLDSSLYVAGTIFMVRAKLLKSLVEKGCVKDEFQESNFRVKGGTLAHDYERIMCLTLQEQGYSIKGFDRSFWKDLATSRIIGYIKKFLFSKRITNNGYILVRILMIPVYHKKLS